VDRSPLERNIALLIDFENIAAGTEKEGLGKFDVDKVMARIKDKGRILISRSYADWGRFARFKQGLLAANVTMYELTSHGMQDKNRADIAMVVDCLELAYTRSYIDTYVVVSGDSDFTPLVLKLKELNKSVIGIGTRRSTSRLIINACDEFIFYDTIVQKPAVARRKAPVAQKVPTERAKVFELVAEVLEGMQREDPKPPFASVLKSAILRRQPDFSEGDAGFPSFTRLLEAARDAGYVALERDKKSGAYTVDSVVEEGDEGGARAEEPRAPSRAGGAYDDPYLPEGAEEVVRRLHAAGLVPLSNPTRMTVLEQLVAAVDDRGKKRRRVNVPFVVEDLQARLRRTHPELTAEHLKGLLRVLMRAGVLVHKDGAPIRNATAQFTIRKTPDQLNRVLANAYLRQLKADHFDLSDRPMLAELLFGDRERTRDLEEMLAWMDASEDEESLFELEEEPAAPAVDEDLDALLVTEDGEEPPAKPVTKAAKAAKPAKPTKPPSVPSFDELDAVLELDEDRIFQLDDEEPAPAEAEAPAEVEAEEVDDLLEVEGGEAEAEDDDKPARKPRRRGGRRKKKGEAVGEA
jgi:uncharacterized protein (TIGR00288 family)